MDIYAQQVLTRGKRGGTYILPSKGTSKDDAMLKFASNRLNDPSAARMKNMRRVMDGVPDVVANANIVTQSTPARLRANAPLQPKQAGTTPTATRVGEHTSLDGWTCSATSLLGNKGLFSFYDLMGKFAVMFPYRSKADLPKLTRPRSMTCTALTSCSNRIRAKRMHLS